MECLQNSGYFCIAPIKSSLLNLCCTLSLWKELRKKRRWSCKLCQDNEWIRGQKKMHAPTRLFDWICPQALFQALFLPDVVLCWLIRTCPVPKRTTINSFILALFLSLGNEFTRINPQMLLM
jgi:hypothetical protein